MTPGGMNANMLWLHNEARTARPSPATMYNLSRRYPLGVRFRVHHERLKVAEGWRTFFKPLIEVVIEVKGRLEWVTYLWFERETFDEV